MFAITLLIQTQYSLDVLLCRYLKNIDKFNEWIISAFVTAGHARFLLLHDQKTDEAAVKAFFTDVYEAYVKAIMNPFYTHDAPIVQPQFDEKVKSIGKKCFAR